MSSRLAVTLKFRRGTPFLGGMRYSGKKVVDSEWPLDEDRPQRRRRRARRGDIPRVAPPPLPIPFPFPFVSSASLPTITTSGDDDFVAVRDSWLLPPPKDGRSASVFPREPEPFTLRPPTLSLPVRG